MIALIIQLLESSEHYGQSENIEIAKGKHILAKTIKGKGISFIEGNNLYHYKMLSDDEYQKAIKELE